MEHRVKINLKLGEGNVNLFLKEVREGKVEQCQIKAIALKMDGTVHGSYKESMYAKMSLPVVTMKMLDQWYSDSLYDETVDGLSQLRNILSHEDVGLSRLVSEMTVSNLPEPDTSVCMTPLAQDSETEDSKLLPTSAIENNFCKKWKWVLLDQLIRFITGVGRYGYL